MATVAEWIRETATSVAEVEKELFDYMQIEDGVVKTCTRRLRKVDTTLREIAGALDDKNERTITLSAEEAKIARDIISGRIANTLTCRNLDNRLRDFIDNATANEPVGCVDLVCDDKALRRVLKRLRKSEKLQGKALDAVEGMFEGIDVRTAELDRELDPLEHEDRAAYIAGYWSAAVGTMRADVAELIELLGGKVDDSDG